MSATIEFKAKARTAERSDGVVLYRYICVPKLKRHHCDMNAFRRHPKHRDFANSDLFEGILARIRSRLFPNGILRLDQIPEKVAVDESGFLAKVTIEE